MKRGIKKNKKTDDNDEAKRDIRETSIQAQGTCVVGSGYEMAAMSELFPFVSIIHVRYGVCGVSSIALV